MPSSRASALLESPIGLQLLVLIAQQEPLGLHESDIAELFGQARALASRFRGDYPEHVESLRRQAPGLADQATALASRMSSWWNPLDRGAQVWIGKDVSVPAADRISIDLERFGLETTKPKRAMWTSTRSGGNISQWLSHGERQGAAFAWGLRVSSEARVAEIHGPEDWRSFAVAYRDATPGYVPNDRTNSAERIDPDWRRVAVDWDGVHLSTGGYLTAEDVPVSRDGMVTELRGWDLESTVWLRWAFSSVERLDVHA